MQAIKTKYLSATNTKHSRIKAECEAGSLTVSYNHSYDAIGMHRYAAFELIKKLEWGNVILHTGELKDCFVHVLEYPKQLDKLNLPEILKDQA